MSTLPSDRYVDTRGHSAQFGWAMYVVAPGGLHTTLLRCLIWCARLLLRVAD